MFEHIEQMKKQLKALDKIAEEIAPLFDDFEDGWLARTAHNGYDIAVFGQDGYIELYITPIQEGTKVYPDLRRRLKENEE